MNPLDAFWHFANFFAPAWFVAALLALFSKLLWRQASWQRLALWGGIGGSLGLLAALVLLGRDGKMLGYGLMLLGVALPQWGLQLKRANR